MRFVSRAEWGARPAKNRTALPDPQGVTWHYEGPKLGAFPHSSCPSKVRAIQNFHMDGRGWSDVAYSDIACPHGYVFEGRGPDVRTAANGTNTGNGSSLAVCALIGDGDVATDDLKHALLDSRARLMAAGTGPRIWGHRDWKATSCPGDPLYAWFKAGSPRPGGSTRPPDSPIPPTDQEDDMLSDEGRALLGDIKATLARIRQDMEADGPHIVVFASDKERMGDGAPQWYITQAGRVWLRNGDHAANMANLHGLSRTPEVWADLEREIPLIGDPPPEVAA